jgi:hypothetical protein
MIIKKTEHGDYCYNNMLVGDDEEFQWNLCLAEIVPNGVGNGPPIYEVTNRRWECVGPVFKSRSEGSRYLGYEGKSEKVREHQNLLIEEYNTLYSDEVETRERFNSANKPKFGRPSEGKDQRLQFSTTMKVRKWLESQQRVGESLSQVVNRILEERMRTHN